VVAAVAVLAGCGATSAPFFVVRNNRPADLFVAYCPTQTCARQQHRLVPSGKAWRVTNLTGVQDTGFIYATLAGQPQGCNFVPPARAMVDRLYVFTTSSMLAAGCAGYNPRRPLGITPRPSR
jgi:hypothetical protein